MPKPGDGQAAHHAGRGRLRASHADREQAIDTLKDAFVQDRLTKDEFDARVGDALASRTHADLAALTADLPAGPPAAQPTHTPSPVRSGNTTVKSGVRVIAATTALTGAVWAGGLQSQTDSQAWSALVWTFTLVWLGIVILVSAVILESRRQERSDRQLPPTHGGGGQGAERRRNRTTRRGAYQAPSRRADFKILPEGPFGSSAMNRISRGYL